MDGKPNRADLILQISMSLAVIWLALPPQERLWIRLRATESVRRVAGRVAAAAYLEGHQGMAAELDSKTAEASKRYTAAFWLSSLRDGLAYCVKVVRP